MNKINKIIYLILIVLIILFIFIIIQDKLKEKEYIKEYNYYNEIIIIDIFTNKNEKKIFNDIDEIYKKNNNLKMNNKEEYLNNLVRDYLEKNNIKKGFSKFLTEVTETTEDFQNDELSSRSLHSLCALLLCEEFKSFRSNLRGIAARRLAKNSPPDCFCPAMRCRSLYL